jgi:flagellar hook-associated protein 2
MGSIISSGIGSGLDVAGLVQQLVQAEGAPKTLRLNAEEAKVQAKLSALGTLRSALASFRDTVAKLKDVDKFQGRSVSLSTPEFLSATASAGAVPGSYDIVVEQLAAPHKVQSAAVESPDAVIGTGTLEIAIGEQTFEIAIGEETNTLAAIAAAINKSAAGAKVVATVVRGADEARLTLAARVTGEENTIAIAQSGGDEGFASFVDGFATLEQARDAVARIDGVLVRSSSNTLKSAIAGVEITLAAADVEESTQLRVEYNRAAASKTIDDLVKSYNAVVEAIKSVASYNAETKVGGPLFGDAGVRNIVYQLRRELTANVTGLTGPFDTLNEIGITADLEGKLSVDSAKLNEAFATDFDAVGELFAAEDVGIAVRLDRLLAPYLDVGGTFDSRTAGLKGSIDDINDRREALSLRLAALQERYTRQFNALDTLVAQLQNTSNFLAQQLSQLPSPAAMLRRKQ